MKVQTEHDMVQKPIVMLAPSALGNHPFGIRIFPFLSANCRKQPNFETVHNIIL
jgi:hypothetical protein